MPSLPPSLFAQRLQLTLQKSLPPFPLPLDLASYLNKSMTMSAPSSPTHKVPTPIPSPQKEAASIPSPKKEGTPASPETKQSSTTKTTTSPSTTGGRASSRTKAQVQRFTDSPAKKAQDNGDGEVQVGPSAPLSEYDSICRNVDKMSSDNDVMIELHRAMYGGVGKQRERKKGIRSWQGCPAGDEKAKAVRLL